MLIKLIALQPFTPCLPIRGGKLKSSKHFSSSNPQLPFLCSSISSYLNHNNHNSSSNSINNSEIWRVASPNNFNLYSSSISSLNATPIKSRYSMNCKTDIRAVSEERPPAYHRPQHLQQQQQPPNNLKKISSNYDNVYNSNPNSPLLLRKNAQQKFWISKSPSNSPPPPHPGSMAQRTYKQYNTIANKPAEKPTIIYDRRLNKSFETANGLMCENHNSPSSNQKNNLKALFRRSSTPQLNSTDLMMDENPRNSVNSTWCCGNFVLKQWKKMNQYWWHIKLKRNWLWCMRNYRFLKKNIIWFFYRFLANFFLEENENFSGFLGFFWGEQVEFLFYDWEERIFGWRF